ncbi:MAG: methyltransferase domain-containing protein [Pseudomonadota bacterium]
MDKDAVRDFYDADPAREWARLEACWLEYAITRRFIKKHLPAAAARVLDLGGGPGRYAIDLAKIGCLVDLADLSPANIAYATKKAAEACISLTSAKAADARNLQPYKEESYDMVLCLGPLYHLHNEADRAKVVTECLRVAKPGAVLFFGFISHLAPYYYLLKTQPETFPKRSPFFRDILYDGRYQAPTKGDSFFTDAYFIDPLEIEPFMSRFGLQPIELFGAESIAAQSENHLAELDEITKNHWLEHLASLATHRAALLASEHVIYVGRKT